MTEETPVEPRFAPAPPPTPAPSPAPTWSLQRGDGGGGDGGGGGGPLLISGDHAGPGAGSWGCAGCGGRPAGGRGARLRHRGGGPRGVGTRHGPPRLPPRPRAPCRRGQRVGGEGSPGQGRGAWGGFRGRGARGRLEGTGGQKGAGAGGQEWRLAQVVLLQEGFVQQVLKQRVMVEELQRGCRAHEVSLCLPLRRRG